jgi:hypothetical protein
METATSPSLSYSNGPVDCKKPIPLHPASPAISQGNVLRIFLHPFSVHSLLGVLMHTYVKSALGLNMRYGQPVVDLRLGTLADVLAGPILIVMHCGCPVL